MQDGSANGFSVEDSKIKFSICLYYNGEYQAKSI